MPKQAILNDLTYSENRICMVFYIDPKENKNHDKEVIIKHLLKTNKRKIPKKKVN